MQGKELHIQAYVSYDKQTGSYVLRRFEGSHPCIGVQQQAGGSIHSVRFVKAKVSQPSFRFWLHTQVSHIRKGFTVTQQATPKQLLAWYRDHHGPFNTPPLQGFSTPSGETSSLNNFTKSLNFLPIVNKSLLSIQAQPVSSSLSVIDSQASSSLPQLQLLPGLTYAQTDTNNTL